MHIHTVPVSLIGITTRALIIVASISVFGCDVMGMNEGIVETSVKVSF